MLQEGAGCRHGASISGLDRSPAGAMVGCGGSEASVDLSGWAAPSRMRGGRRAAGGRADRLGGGGDARRCRSGRTGRLEQEAVLHPLGCGADLVGEPDRHRVDGAGVRAGAGAAVPEGAAAAVSAPGTVERSAERMWTARLRRRAVRAFPPDQLLPDRQPAYVASWI